MGGKEVGCVEIGRKEKGRKYTSWDYMKEGSGAYSHKQQLLKHTHTHNFSVILQQACITPSSLSRKLAVQCAIWIEEVLYIVVMMVMKYEEG